MEAIRNDMRYTYADYHSWDDEVRRELIDGVAYMLSAPAWEHQRVSHRLSLQLGNFLVGKTCEVYSAPFDVRLNAAERDDTVVQPDLVVICDRSKLRGTGCVGTPDMVIEILSPATAARDKLIKLNMYLRYGVREYWIIDPDNKMVSVHILENNNYVIRAYGNTDVVPVHILAGCTVKLSDVFDE